MTCQDKQCNAKELARFISETRTSESTHSHVLLGAPFGKINVCNSRMKEFWDLYMACVHDGYPVYLAEKPGIESPVLVDIDLKTRWSSACSGRIYTDDQVKQVVSAYQTILKQDVLQDVPSSSLVCVLLEKKPYKVILNGIEFIKNGFHLHFPKCFIDRNVQEAFVVPNAKKRLAGLFDNLYTIDGGSSSSVQECHYDFIDSASIKVHWLLYGSQKPGNKPYIATKCFLDGAIEASFEEALGDYVLPKLTGERSAVSCRDNVIPLLPRILSIQLYGRLQYYCKSKPSVCTPIFDIMLENRSRRPEYEQKRISESLEEVRQYMALISDERADDRSDWIAIGFCLWNVTKGSDEGLVLWLEFSENSDKFNEAECICIWQGMRSSNYTIGTLKYYAKTDNPREYAKICKKIGNDLIDKAADGGHNDLAKLLYNEYGDEFVYSTTNDCWYIYEKHIWVQCKKCFSLSERISDNNGAIISSFREHISAATNRLRVLGRTTTPSYAEKKRDDEDIDEDQEEEVEKLRIKIKTMNKLIKQCKNNSFKHSVMKECQEVFRNDSFTDKLNTNPYLVAFQNGVYDFKNDGFRAGNPEDYLSKCLPIEYKDYGTRDNPDVMEVASFFRKVLVDDQVRTYFLDQVSQVFVGGNEDKVLLIWTGTGDNGKSVTQRLFEKMLGPLAVKASTSLVTDKKTKTGQAAPELARTGNGVRWLVMDEPSQDEEITTGLLKSLTGNDSFWARDLYRGGEDTKEIIPLFKMHMLCNKLPGIRSADEAFWNRIRVIPFESKFVDEELCPPSYEEQMAKKIFPSDRKFNQKIDGLLQPLAWYLISHWRGLIKSDRIVPDKVKIATGEYREENINDPRQEFIDENIVRKDVVGQLSVSQVYERYKYWFKNEHRNEKLALKRVTLTEFDKILGKRTGDIWPNWTWKDQEDHK